MTGSEVGDNPWKSLAAKVINRARADCRGAVGTGIEDNMTRALLQYDAEHWLEYDPWCQYLLDCALPWECDVPQSLVLSQERKRRWKNYRKYLPFDTDFDEQFPIHALAKLTGLSKTRLNDAAQEGRLEATQGFNGVMPIWCTSITEIARAVARGTIIIHRRGYK